MKETLRLGQITRLLSLPALMLLLAAACSGCATTGPMNQVRPSQLQERALSEQLTLASPLSS